MKMKTLLAQITLTQAYKGVVEIKDKVNMPTDEIYQPVDAKEILISKFYLENERTVSCEILNSNGELIGYGKAMCHEEDRFDIQKGLALSEFRARANMFENISDALAKEY